MNNTYKAISTMRDKFKEYESRVIHAFDLPKNGLEALVFLSKNDLSRIGEISKEINISNTMASMLVARLEGMGMVKRIHSKRDRRTVDVTLRNLGYEVINEYNDYPKDLAEKLKGSEVLDVLDLCEDTE